MCQFKSAIVTRTGDVLHHDMTDSHEDLIAYFGLRDDNHLDHFVRVEYRPYDTGDLPNVEKYNLIVDEGEVPNWFNEFRESTVEKMRAIVSRYILRDVERKIILDGCWIITGKSIIDRLKGGRIILLDGGTVREVRDGGTVQNVQGGGTVQNVQDGGTVQKDFNRN